MARDYRGAPRRQRAARPSEDAKVLFFSKFVDICKVSSACHILEVSFAALSNLIFAIDFLFCSIVQAHTTCALLRRSKQKNGQKLVTETSSGLDLN